MEARKAARSRARALHAGVAGLGDGPELQEQARVRSRRTPSQSMSSGPWRITGDKITEQCVVEGPQSLPLPSPYSPPGFQSREGGNPSDSCRIAQTGRQEAGVRLPHEVLQAPPQPRATMDPRQNCQGLLKDDMKEQVIQGAELVKKAALSFHNQELQAQSQEGMQLVPFAG
ncbi:unnamed protein product [Miscanthus lutarioriparius]|uniref:Uncharacterized protein n=1 Tax=Miscanthus lutarioriparius TaxID=422564 RepID=A0A811RBJ4_9POAL|nr:unnamed protein product [Miscanthus lutarioriparius]